MDRRDLLIATGTGFGVGLGVVLVGLAVWLPLRGESVVRPPAEAAILGMLQQDFGLTRDRLNGIQRLAELGQRVYGRVLR